MYRLCYQVGEGNGFLYFTDNFEKQWGDDWDDAPYEHNADSPYEYRDDLSEDINSCRGHLKIIAYFTPYWIDYERQPDLGTPCSRCGYNSSYSVEDINNGAIAWLYDKNSKTGLMAGTSINKAIKWLRSIGCICHILQ